MSDILTHIEVEDLIYSTFLNIMRTDCEKLLGYTPYIKWPGDEPSVDDNKIIAIDGENFNTIENDGKINSNLHWVRVQIQPVDNKRMGHKKSVYYKIGMFCIEWFSPKNNGSAYREMQEAKLIIRNTLIDKRIEKSLRFRGGETKPQDPTGNSYKSKTIIEYKYIDAPK